MASAASRRLHVLGPGAMGSLWAARLCRAGHHVTLMTRDVDAHPEKFIKVCETFEGGGEPWEAKVALEGAKPKGRAEPVDTLLVAVKAYDVVDALVARADRLTPETVVVLLPNGMGWQRQLLAHPALLHVGLWVAGSVSHGCRWNADGGQLLHTGFGTTAFGWMPQAIYPPASVAGSRQGGSGAHGRGGTQEEMHAVLRDLVATLGTAGLGSDIAEDMHSILWKKLAVNACINPLTAVIGCKNGAIASMEPTVRGIVEEVVVAARSEGVQLDEEETVKAVLHVARATRLNDSSMLMDIKLKRPRTEVEYISGYVARVSHSCGQEAPRNALLTELVQKRRDACAADGESELQIEGSR